MQLSLWLLVLSVIRYDSFSIDGVLPVQNEEIAVLKASHFPLKASRDSVEAFITDMLILLRDNGFPYAKIKPNGVDVVGGRYIIRLKVDPGQSAVIESVAVDSGWRKYNRQIADFLGMKGMLFNRKMFDRKIDEFRKFYGIEVDSFWFQPSDNGSVLFLSFRDRRKEMVQGMATYEKGTGIVGQLNAVLNRSLGGMQSLKARWMRRNALSQSIYAEYRNPWLLGNRLGIDARLRYEASPEFIVGRYSVVMFRRFRAVEVGVGGGMQRGTISRKFGVFQLNSELFDMRLEVSDGLLRVESEAGREFPVDSFLNFDAKIGAMWLVEDGAEGEPFRFGGPPKFMGSVPEGISCKTGVWGSGRAQWRSLFVFLSAGRFDGQNIIKAGPGISTRNFNLSLSLPDMLVTVYFKAIF